MCLKKDKTQNAYAIQDSGKKNIKNLMAKSTAD